MPRSEASVPSRGRRRWRRHRRRPPLRSRRRRLRRRPRRSRSFGGDRDTPPFASGAAARRPRLEMFAVEKAPKPSASTPTPPRPVGPPRKVVLASFEPARVRVPLAPVARNVAVVAPDEREREADAAADDERGNEERGDGKEPRPSPIVPAEPLKRLSPEPSPPLEPSTEPETGAQTCRSRTPTRRRRAPFPPGRKRRSPEPSPPLQGTVSSTRSFRRSRRERHPSRLDPRAWTSDPRWCPSLSRLR